MGRPRDSQDDWVSFAGELAKNGYQALTYERGAFGDAWQDVHGAADYLRDNGAETVIAAGASLGAMASLYAAERPRSGLNGVIRLAGVLQNRSYPPGHRRFEDRLPNPSHLRRRGHLRCRRRGPAAARLDHRAR
jgi:hypothetical protein